eukprot:15431526-Alexandrium_andersonii.AAC.1
MPVTWEHHLMRSMRPVGTRTVECAFAKPCRSLKCVLSAIAIGRTCRIPEDNSAALWLCACEP